MFFTPDDYGFGVRQQVGRLMVGPVKYSGPLATLQTGDEIVSFDGENIRYQTDLVTAFRRQPPDSSYSIVVRRDGQLLHLTLHKDTPSLGFYIRRLIYVLVPVSFILMGLVVFLLKPDDKPALLLGLWFGAISTGFPAELYMLLPGWLMWIAVTSSILRWFLIPLCLHFFLIFPEQSPLLRRFPRLETDASRFPSPDSRFDHYHILPDRILLTFAEAVCIRCYSRRAVSAPLVKQID